MFNSARKLDSFVRVFIIVNSALAVDWIQISLAFMGDCDFSLQYLILYYFNLVFEGR